MIKNENQAGLLVVSFVLFFAIFSILNFFGIFSISGNSSCDEFTVEYRALSYARSNYGAGASATGCTFEAGKVRKRGNTFLVTVFCGGNNPIDFTYECTNGDLTLVSVN